MFRVSTFFLAFALSAFSKPYDLNCRANNQPIGENWLVSAEFKGTIDRGVQSATLEDFDASLVIQEVGKKAPFAETQLHTRSLQNDEFYLPVKYKNHYRFELYFDKTKSYSAEKVDFLLPKLFEADRANRAYLILNHINNTFGGTIALRCDLKAN